MYVCIQTADVVANDTTTKCVMCCAPYLDAEGRALLPQKQLANIITKTETETRVDPRKVSIWRYSAVLRYPSAKAVLALNS